LSKTRPIKSVWKIGVNSHVINLNGSPPGVPQNPKTPKN
jgi:hypothetical protein